jgi:hypothetical protein
MTNPAKTSLAALALAAIAGLALASPAAAGSLGRPCTDAPQGQWMSVEALRAKIEAQGFKVQKGSIKKQCGEFYTTDKTGAQVELFLNPTNGDIVGRM